MFDAIKIYIAGAIASVVIILAAIFKYRGDKITSLKKDLKEVKEEIVIKEKVTKSIAKQKEFEKSNSVAATKVTPPKDWSKVDDKNPIDTFYSI